MITTNFCMLELDKNIVSQCDDKLQVCKPISHPIKCGVCSGPIIESNCCMECKIPVFIKCLNCGKREYADTHDYCYCQLDVLTT